MKIINSVKFAKNFDELYDHVDDNTVEVLDQYSKEDIEVDYDSIEEGQRPITENNVDDYLADYNLEEDGGGVAIEEPPTDDFIPEVEQPEALPEATLPEALPEVPTEEEAQEQATPAAEDSVPDPEDDAKAHFGSDVTGALSWAKENKRVVQIFYNTEGRKRGRGGNQYLKRELKLPKLDNGGVSINRIIEPHYFFYAKKTKRWIMVTYDRSVRHVRAYILDNITDYNFTKKRGTDDDQYFGNRRAIKLPVGEEMPIKPNKGMSDMENINRDLTEMEAALQSKGLIKSAAIIQTAKKAVDNLKTAQYVGVQGYWIRNRRCWDNCYRQKRTTQPETPAQEVWMECWDEYKESINNDKSGWEKYAEQGKNVRISFKKELEWNNDFISKVSEKVDKEGYTTPEAIYATITEESQIQVDKILESSAQLMELANVLKESGQDELGDRLADISAAMLKESDFFGLGDVVKEAQFQGGDSGWGPLGRGFNKVKNWWTGKGGKEDVVKKLQDVVDRANTMLRHLNAGQVSRGDMQASSNRIVIEAGKEMKIAQRRTNPNRPGGKGFMSNEEMEDEARTWDTGYNTEGAAQNENLMFDEQAARQENTLISDEQAARNQNAQFQQQDQQSKMKQRSMIAAVEKQYGQFMKDTQALAKEFQGLAATGNDETKSYVSKALPFLQQFINSSGKLYGSKSYIERQGILRESLQNVVAGLQGVVSGQSGLGDIGLGDTGVGQAGVDQAGVGQAMPIINDPITNQISQLGQEALMDIKNKIDIRLRELNSKAASYNHKLKIMK